MRSLLTLGRITYSPQATTNKKPALGGLEKAQALRSFQMPTRDNSPAIIASSQIRLSRCHCVTDQAAAAIEKLKAEQLKVSIDKPPLNGKPYAVAA